MEANKKEMKVLIVGASGQLGRSLQDAFSAREIDFLALSREDLDICNEEKVYETVANSNADVVINSAAYTDVEEAERDSEQAYKINEIGVRNLARASRKNNSKLINFSTDYVFSGLITKPWHVDSKANPITVYGKSKLAGENVVMKEYLENSLIIRTAWLYSPYGKNFYKTILNLALKNSEPVKVVNDQIGQPTNALDLSNLVISALDRNVPSGIYHGTNSGGASWYDFAYSIFNLAGADLSRLKPVRSSEYRTLAKRPEYSVLDNSKWVETGLNPLGPWQESVEKAFPSIFSSMS